MAIDCEDTWRDRGGGGGGALLVLVERGGGGCKDVGGSVDVGIVTLDDCDGDSPSECKCRGVTCVDGETAEDDLRR